MMTRIMVVEDNPVNMRIIENGIAEKSKDIEVLTVNNASEAIFYYLTQHFDLVFLDIMMPKISGYHFLTIIEENIKAGHIKQNANIVVQTAIQALAELTAIAEKEIVQDVIRKPITIQQIHECIEIYC